MCQRSHLVAPGTRRTKEATGGPRLVVVAGQKERTSPASESSGCTTSGTSSKPRRRRGTPC
jgi:hypothetical protein